jgi:hypothetical protein
VVWAGGPDVLPANHDELSDRLERIGGPAVGWNQHRGVPLPTGDRAAALSIPVADALGWLVAAGNGLGGDGVGSSVTWLGRVAVAAVRMVARGAIVPALRTNRRSDGRALDLNVRWIPADIDRAETDELAAAMPGPVVAMARSEAKAVVVEVLRAVVDAIASDAATRVELPAPPPVVRTGADVAWTAGSSRSPAPGGPASSCSSILRTRGTPGTCRSWAPVPRATSCRSSSP